MLKRTLDLLIRDNKELKASVKKIRDIVKSNKFQMQEYLNKITNKDSAVKNLNNTIDKLKRQFSYIKMPLLKVKQRHSSIVDVSDISFLSRLSLGATRNKPHNGFIQKTFDNEKFKDYCDKQHQLLEEISKIRFELNNVVSEEKIDNNVITTRNQIQKQQNCKDGVLEKRKINLTNIFNEEYLAKVIENLSIDNNNNNNNDNGKESGSLSKYFIIDNYNHVWEMKRRLDLHENNIINMKHINPTRTKLKFTLNINSDSINNSNTDIPITMYQGIVDTENNIKPIKHNTNIQLSNLPSPNNNKCIKSMLEKSLLF